MMMIKPRKITWSGDYRDEKYVQKLENLKGRDLGVDGRILLKLVLRK
jgi:hypothetical protein